jgi:hypothetical protein
MALISRLGCRRSARATMLARTILTSWTVSDSIDVEELTAEVDCDTRDDQSADAAYEALIECSQLGNLPEIWNCSEVKVLGEVEANETAGCLTFELQTVDKQRSWNT